MTARSLRRPRRRENAAGDGGLSRTSLGLEK